MMEVSRLILSVLDVHTERDDLGGRIISTYESDAMETHRTLPSMATVRVMVRSVLVCCEKGSLQWGVNEGLLVPESRTRMIFKRAISHGPPGCASMPLRQGPKP